jgi:hypothetical protein
MLINPAKSIFIYAVNEHKIQRAVKGQEVSSLLNANLSIHVSALTNFAFHLFIVELTSNQSIKIRKTTDEQKACQ